MTPFKLFCSCFVQLFILKSILGSLEQPSALISPRNLIDYIVDVRTTDKFFCTGVLIAKTLVLTASKCGLSSPISKMGVGIRGPSESEKVKAAKLYIDVNQIESKSPTHLAIIEIELPTVTTRYAPIISLVADVDPARNTLDGTYYTCSLFVPDKNLTDAEHFRRRILVQNYVYCLNVIDKSSILESEDCAELDPLDIKHNQSLLGCPVICNGLVRWIVTGIIDNYMLLVDVKESTAGIVNTIAFVESYNKQKEEKKSQTTLYIALAFVAIGLLLSLLAFLFVCLMALWTKPSDYCI